MQPVHLFDLASRHAQWVASRQTTVAGNIANANTPGYRTAEIAPFRDVLDATGLALARTDAAHMSTDGTAGGVDDGQTFDVTATDRPVSLDREMIKADEDFRAFSFDTNVTRAFHRMILASVRSGS